MEENNQKFIPTNAFSPLPGMLEWETVDGITCLTFSWEAVTEASIDIDAENKILSKRGIKDEEGNPLVLKDVRDYFLKVKARELGGIDSPLFQQEYCNAWDAATKKLAAFHQFDFHSHTKYYKGPIHGDPVEVFIDFGTQHPCAGTVQGDRYSEPDQALTFYHFHDVIRGEMMSFDNFFDMLINYLNTTYRDSPQIFYPVQEAKIRSSQGFTSEDGSFSPIEAMVKKGLRVMPANYSKIAPRVQLTNEMLSKFHKGRPIFNFNGSCRDWVEMLEGGYRKEKITRFKQEVYTESYFKDGYHDHLADGWTSWVNTKFGKYGDDGKSTRNYKGKIRVRI